MAEPTAIFHHLPHPRTTRHIQGTAAPPAPVDEGRVGLNGRLGLIVTATVGTMWAAYAFAALALVSLPAALTSGSSIIIVAWIAQTFLQLVLLPVIIVGQNIQARASDKRAEETFRDAEALLHEFMQIQAHLDAQDVQRGAQFAEIEQMLRAR